MNLRDRLFSNPAPAVPNAGNGGTKAKPRPPASPERAVNDRYAARSRIHRKVIERLDLRKVREVSRAQAEGELRSLIGEIIATDEELGGRGQSPQFVEQILDEIFGLGPLEPLLADSEITDILVNGYQRVYAERKGRLFRTDIIFQDDAHLLQIIDRIVSAVGRRVDEASPMVDARLSDGSRVNAIIPPLALDGPCLSIRRFGFERMKMEDLLRGESLTPEMAEFLQAAVRSKMNILLSGGTGSGKTTLLNIVSSFIDEAERVVTIEDAAELQLQQEHVVRLETRPPNIEGKGAIVARDLVRNSLRMRPDRIIVGEARGPEAFDMMQAMNTGHEGSMTTVHANTPRDALSRLEVMIAMAGMDLPHKVMRQQISTAIHLLVHVSRLVDGSRKITSITEITGMEGDIITLQDIFVFEQRGVNANGKVVGVHRATGVHPRSVERFARYGMVLSSGRRGRVEED